MSGCFFLKHGVYCNRNDIANLMGGSKTDVFPRAAKALAPPLVVGYDRITECCII